MKHTTKMREHSYPSFGICIYCLEKFEQSELTDEHIIPLALNGTLIIKRAACDPCRDYTNKTFENLALQADFLVPRLLLELKRRKKKIPKTLPRVNLVTPEGTRIEEIELELAQYPRVISFFTFEPPGILAEIDRGEGLESFRISTFALPTPNTYKHKTVETTHKFDFTSFALTLAKIGYCFAVAEIGLANFDGNAIRDLINGKRMDIFNFVGGFITKDSIPNNQLHLLMVQQHGDYYSVAIHLFSSFSPQSYEVVVGEKIAHKITKT